MKVEEKAAVEHRPLRIPAGQATIHADLCLPDPSVALVVFAHGSGSSRSSPRNRHVAAMLQRGRIATVLADLLTPAEEAVDEHTRHHRFDIGLLARRVAAVTDWLHCEPDLAGLPVGYFGASTGAGAALVATAMRPADVGAVVSRGGRPDLAGDALVRVQAPTLLLVGGQDGAVIDLNKRALAQLRCVKSLVIVPGATHLFEEPGTLDIVAAQARDWFLRHLPRRA